jgi:hypothetical protein
MGSVEEALSVLRQVERGVLQAPDWREFCIMFEKTPVWLLALDAEVVKHVWIMGAADSAGFYEALESSSVDTKLIRAASTNISKARVSYTMNPTLKPDTVGLASGSFEYVR